MSDEKQGAAPARQVFYKFLMLLVLLASYFFYLSIKFDIVTGGIASALTWSFFVLCTPIADAGFLLDFPLRLLFNIRMVISEICVWALAIGMNAAALLYAPDVYQKTTLTRLLQAILVTPYPYWSVVAISGVGTFLSIRFADELMDVVHHRDRHIFHRHGFKHELVIIVFFVLALIGYYKLIASLGINTSM